MPFPSSRPAAGAAPAQSAQPAAAGPAAPRWGAGAQSAAAPVATPAQQPAPAAAPGRNWGGGGRTQPAASRSPFAGVESAEVYQRNAYIQDGDYILKVLSVIFKEGRNSNMVIIEADVIVSNYDPTSAPSANHEGTRISTFINAKNDSFLSNVKEFIIAASGFDPSGNPRPLDDQVSADECEQAMGPDQPLAGALLYVKAREIMTKSNTPFTRVAYHPAALLPDGSPDLNKCIELYGA